MDDLRRRASHEYGRGMVWFTVKGVESFESCARAFAVLVVPSKLQELDVTPIARAPPKPLPTLY